MGTVTLTLQAKPVSSIHVRGNRSLLILEERFMAASPKTVFGREPHCSASNFTTSGRRLQCCSVNHDLLDALKAARLRRYFPSPRQECAN